MLKKTRSWPIFSRVFVLCGVIGTGGAVEHRPANRVALNQAIRRAQFSIPPLDCDGGCDAVRQPPADVHVEHDLPSVSLALLPGAALAAERNVST